MPIRRAVQTLAMLRQIAICAIRIIWAVAQLLDWLAAAEAEVQRSTDR